MPWLSIATPYPGTALSRFLLKQNIELTPFHTGNYDTNHFSFRHPIVPPQIYYDAILQYYRSLSSDAVIRRKIIRLQSGKFDRWAVHSVLHNLRSVAARAERLYSDFL
jgi:hypothetical protein